MLNASIANIPLPKRMAHRPVSERGFPVPWFVSYINGKWDFVNLDPRKIGEAYRRKICWLCGDRLGQYHSYCIGPMCAINRVSAEPSSHRECCQYAARACPFLSRPNARRNTAAHLGDASDVPGVMIEHNPGVTLVWTSKSCQPFQAGDGYLFNVGEPLETEWFCEGRAATRAEIMAAIDKGLPLLRKHAATESGGIEALNTEIARAMKLIPAE
jgi:hypothetical protein